MVPYDRDSGDASDTHHFPGSAAPSHVASHAAGWGYPPPPYAHAMHHPFTNYSTDGNSAVAPPSTPLPTPLTADDHVTSQFSLANRSGNTPSGLGKRFRSDDLGHSSDPAAGESSLAVPPPNRTTNALRALGDLAFETSFHPGYGFPHAVPPPLSYYDNHTMYQRWWPPQQNPYSPQDWTHPFADRPGPVYPPYSTAAPYPGLPWPRHEHENYQVLLPQPQPVPSEPEAPAPSPRRMRPCDLPFAGVDGSPPPSPAPTVSSAPATVTTGSVEDVSALSTPSTPAPRPPLEPEQLEAALATPTSIFHPLLPEETITVEVWDEKSKTFRKKVKYKCRKCGQVKKSHVCGGKQTSRNTSKDDSDEDADNLLPAPSRSTRA